MWFWFAFPWWFMILGISAYIHLVSICVSSIDDRLLMSIVHFLSRLVIFCCSCCRSWIYSGYWSSLRKLAGRYLFRFRWVFPHAIDCFFHCAEYSEFEVMPFVQFAVLPVLSKNLSLVPLSWSIPIMCSLSHFKAPGFKSGLPMHVELAYVYCERCRYNFIL